MIHSGLDVLVRERFRRLGRQRLGILCHPASCDTRFVHLLDHASAAELDVRALFGPEHGLTGFAQDMEAVGAAARHPRFSCPVYTLYGDTDASLSPTKAMLDGLDAVVIDLADIGSRYYTFIWTAVLMMRACAGAGCRVIVLDRPNPLGGTVIEGGGVDQGFLSFVGLYDVPVRHGLTIGEMLELVRREERLTVELEIVAVEGWQRQRTAPAWVYPSPNMPTPATALVYPGLCLLEATNVSEGRGTTKPFEVIGAKYVDGRALAAELTKLEEPGVIFRPLEFKPMFHKFAGQLCGGVELHVTDAEAFRPFHVGVRLVYALANLYPKDFAWRTEPYEFVRDKNAFDLLTGTSAYREAFGSLNALAQVLADRERRAHAFALRRAPVVRY